MVTKCRSEEQVLLEFMDSFRASRDKSTGVITLDEFEQYYANLRYLLTVLYELTD